MRLAYHRRPMVAQGLDIGFVHGYRLADNYRYEAHVAWGPPSCPTMEWVPVIALSYLRRNDE